MQTSDIPIGFEHISNLLPRVIHVLFGIGFDNLCAVTCRHAKTRVEI
jgi:hypothetical protein